MNCCLRTARKEGKQKYSHDDSSALTLKECRLQKLLAKDRVSQIGIIRKATGESIVRNMESVRSTIESPFPRLCHE